MEGHADHTDFARDAFRAPAEVTGVNAEGSVFGVAATGADEVDAFVADSGVCWLAAFLKCSVWEVLLDSSSNGRLGGCSHCDLALPLLAIVRTLRTSGRALVTRVSGDTHDRGAEMVTSEETIVSKGSHFAVIATRWSCKGVASCGPRQSSLGAEGTDK